MPMITFNNNSRKKIPINIYTKKVVIDGEWGGDAEISMIPLNFNDMYCNL